MPLSGLSHSGWEDDNRRKPDEAAVGFLAVGRQEQRIAVRIARDEADIERQRIAQHGRDVVAGGALGGAAEHERGTAAPACVLDRFHRRILARDQQIGIVGVARRGAEPGELARIEPDIGIVADDAQQRHVAGKGGEHGAVLGGGIVKVIDRAQAAGTRHVLDDDGGIARDVLAQMGGDEAPVNVIAAARSIPDHQIDHLALVEIRHPIGARRRAGQHQHEESRRHPERYHRGLLPPGRGGLRPAPREIRSAARLSYNGTCLYTCGRGIADKTQGRTS